MAKKIILSVGVRTILNLPLIHHFHDDNSRQESFDNPLSDLNFPFDKPDTYNDSANKGKGLVRLLFNGWDESKGTVKVMTVESFARLRKITVEEVLQNCEADRRKQIAAWEAEENSKGLANVAKMVWFPDGKMVEPIAIGNEAYRRTYAAMGVIYKRTLNPAYGGDMTFTIPVNVVDFASDLEKIVSHAQENDKDSGRSEYAPLDYLKLAVQIVRSMGNEADVVRAGVKRGTAQKVHRIAQLGFKYPTVKLVERCFGDAPKDGQILAYDKEGYIPLAKLDKEHAGRLLAGYSYNDTNKTEPIEVTPDTIHNWLSAVILGKTEKSPSMSGTQIQQLSNNPCKIVQAFSKAVAKNDTAFFTNLAPYHEILDKAFAEVLKLQGKLAEAVAPQAPLPQPEESEA